MTAPTQTTKARALFAQHPALKIRYDRARRIAGVMRPSQYDISDTCNLKCEGCLYFAGSDRHGVHEQIALDVVDRFFAAEAARGVNFAQLGGAEPALAPDKLKIIARHIPRGLIFSNGTIRIDPEIRYRIHISVWGEGEDARILRGADSFKKALKLYAGDDRAIFIFTISRHNLDSIQRVARICSDSGVKLSFSHFSPTELYVGAVPPEFSDYSRMAGAGQPLNLELNDLVRAQREIASAMVAFPNTVIYSAFFNDWVHRPDGLYRLDEQGVATDCGSRVTASYRHFKVDLRVSENVKCCAPNLSCRTCRIYAQSIATALHRFNDFTASRTDFMGWLEMYEFWGRLFLLDRTASSFQTSQSESERACA